MRRKLRLVAVTAVIAVLATGAYAFTAPNSVPASSAGFGAGDISGYTVSNISYGLDGDGSTDIFGNNLETLTFDIAGTTIPSDVTVWIDNSASSPDVLYSVENGDCDVTGASSPWQVSCDINEFPADVEQLRIGAAQ